MTEGEVGPRESASRGKVRREMEKEGGGGGGGKRQAGESAVPAVMRQLKKSGRRRTRRTRSHGRGKTASRGAAPGFLPFPFVLTLPLKPGSDPAAGRLKRCVTSHSLPTRRLRYAPYALVTHPLRASYCAAPWCRRGYYLVLSMMKPTAFAFLALLPSTLAFPPTPFANGFLLNLTSACLPSCSWTLTTDAEFKNAASNLCLTASNPSSGSGVVYLSACGGMNQSWTWVGAEMDGGVMYIGGGAQGQMCLTGVDPSGDPPSATVLSACSFAPWQQMTSEDDGNGTLALENLPSARGNLYVCSPTL